MTLPNLSNSMYVAHLRHIQSIHEPLERRNPDKLVRYFIPITTRLRASWLGQAQLSKLRTDPFYYYLIARTKYYDQVINDAVLDGVQRIVSVGCGTDTRAYRFREVMRKKGVKVLECDQADAINAKQRLARRWPESDHIEHMPIDLNDGVWPVFERWLMDRAGVRSLVLMEGVSPYIDESAFSQFLRLLANKLAAGSQLAYDFKLRGVADQFGQTGQTQKPFRLTAPEVAEFHAAHGFRLDNMELSSQLGTRLLPHLKGSAAPLFHEDGLVRLRVARD